MKIRNTNKSGKNFCDTVRTILIKAAVILLLPFNLIAQSQFNKNYDYGNTWAEWGWNINIDSGLFTVFRAAWPLANANSSILFSQFDYNGNIVSEKVLDTLVVGRYSLGTSHCAKKIKNGFAVVGSIERPQPYEWRAYFLKTDFNGDTTFIKTYLGDSLLFIGYNIVPTFDSGYAIIGIVKDTGTTASSKTDIYLLKTDSNGNELWHKTFGTLTVNDVGYCIFELPNKNLIISGVKKISSSNYSPWIIITDSAGNMINEKVWGAGSYTFGGGYASIGLKNQILKYGLLDTLITSGDYAYPSYIMELNSDFSYRWRTILNSSQENFIYYSKQIEDSSIVFVGYKVKPIDTSGSYPLGWIVKLDKDGNFIWEHSYQYCISQANYFSDFQQMPDGGYIISGSTIGCDSAQALMTNQDLWLVRLDSNGCLVPGCITNAGTIETGRNKLDVYPNPVSDLINIDWWLKGIDNAQLIIYNLLGQPVIQTQLNDYRSELNISNLPRGFYIINIGNGKEQMQSKFLRQ